MNGESKPTSEPDEPGDKSGSAAFLPVGIVFGVLGLSMMILGNMSWIAFFTVGITFMILGMQGRAEKPQEPPANDQQG
jgi:hypothetical protein